MDITFVGSGIATTFTLLPMLESVIKHGSEQGLVRIAVIEKNTEWFTGLAYGPKSGESALLITSLADFLQEGELRQEFISWLIHNSKALIEDLRNDGGSLSLNWIRTHKDDIEAGDWEDIYIPRRFFGKYLKEKVNKLIDKAKANDQIELFFIQDEVSAIDKSGNGYSLHFNSGRTALRSEKVVLSVGIPPSKEYWTSGEEQKLNDQVCLIADPYNPGLTENLEKIRNYVNKGESGNVLIIGANASAMEMIYKLNDEPEIRPKLGDFLIISPKGELPNSAQDDFTRMVRFIPENLLALEGKDDLTAWEIYKAANLDLDAAENRGFGTAISEIPISKAFISLLESLNSEELQAFASLYGNEIGKRQRRAGKHYTDVVDHLMAQNRIRNIKGYFTSLISDERTTGVRFDFKLEPGKKERISEQKIDIVINCSGSKTLDEKNLPELLVQLMNAGLCVINPSRRGFLVDNDMQCSKGFYVAGPLLAGNVIEDVPFWHLEHCGRIIKLGERLAHKLLNREPKQVWRNKTL